MAADYSEVVAPSNVTVDLERKPVLHLPDGRVLVRVPGFSPGATVAVPPRKTER
jgi:hypothetical protein